MKRLIDRLRECSTYGFKQEICEEAANAIEKLQAELADYRHNEPIYEAKIKDLAEQTNRYWNRVGELLTENAQLRKEREWIPVTERLPDMHTERYEDSAEPTGYGEYLESDVVVAYTPSDNRYRSASCTRSIGSDRIVWIDDVSLDEIHPSHWMLPDPPKE